MGEGPKRLTHSERFQIKRFFFWRHSQTFYVECWLVKKAHLVCSLNLKHQLRGNVIIPCDSWLTCIILFNQKSCLSLKWRRGVFCFFFPCLYHHKLAQFSTISYYCLIPLGPKESTTLTPIHSCAHHQWGRNQSNIRGAKVVKNNLFAWKVNQ